MAHAYDPHDLNPETKLLRKFDDAWLASLELIKQISQQEKQAEEDRLFAATIDGITLNPIPDNIRRRAILPEYFDDKDEGKPKKCTICMERVSKSSPRTPCGDTYCIGCLKQLFMLSMQDETLMPPSCCQQKIPIALAQLTPKETEDFNAKLVEYTTTDRLYCSQPTCSTFISPELIINKVGTCPKSDCGATTCSICKAASHNNLDCPKDEATVAFLAAASEAGWTRCYRCGAMVELNHGCNHMTCRCHAEFCYVCSIQWKNCSCPRWDEERLIEAARDRIVGIPVIQIPQATEGTDFNQRLELMANQLRPNYECRHTVEWIYTSGGGRCEECNDFLPLYLYRCRQCHFMACNRCRHNRL